MALYGADTAELRALANRLEQAAQRLDSARQQLGRQLGATPWRGPDGARFRQVWNSQHTQQITTAVHELNNAATALRRNAQEQDTASAVGGHAAPAGAATGSNPLDRLSEFVQDLTGRLPGEMARIMIDYAEAASRGSTGIGAPLAKVTGGLSSGYGLLTGLSEHDDLKVLTGAIGLGSLIPLSPLNLAIGPVLLYAGATLPTSKGDVDAVVNTGARHLFGKNSGELTPDQAQKLVDRYEPPLPWGVANMISDSMDSKAEAAKSFFKGLLGG